MLGPHCYDARSCEEGLVDEVVACGMMYLTFIILGFFDV